jgi:serine protease Do
MTWLSVPRRFLGAALAAAATSLVVPALFGLVSTPALAQAVNLPDFTELVERVGPAVVNIRTTERSRASAQGREVDPAMEEFFRRFGIPMPGGRPDPRRGTPRGDDDGQPQQRGVGSGFILSADGFVMTNAHVVDGADEVIVTLTDKREFKARIIGADARTDVAVVKIEASGLPFVKVGDVNRLKVGEWVMAIGSPFGLSNSVTAGIVSAKARDTGDYVPFIQTDVAINPGNSGGPLVNLRGEVVGINSQIYSRTGGFMGISFAIPMDEATRVADQLRSSGRVIRGRIGVDIAAVTKEVAESIGLGKATGALVRGVIGGSPAEKAGVEAGDIITRVDGRNVESDADLRRIIGGTKPGTRSTLQVFRRGTTRDLNVVVAELEPDRPVARAGAEPQTAPMAKNALGIMASDLTEAQRREAKVTRGVRVDAVDGAAARAGLREGDIITALDNVEINDTKQLAAVSAKVEKSRAVSVMVKRDQWTNYLVIRPNR